MSASVKIPMRMSVEEFLAWNPPGSETWQLVDGEPHAMAPSNRTHGSLQGRVAQLIGSHLDGRANGCSVVVEPGITPHVNAGINVRVPDLAVTCSPYESEQPTLSDPVLVIEILSPSNQAETWSNIWTYTSIPSVREILVLRTAFIGADLLRRAPDGTWPETPATIGADAELHLACIDFRCTLADLYRTTRLATR